MGLAGGARSGSWGTGGQGHSKGCVVCGVRSGTALRLGACLLKGLSLQAGLQALEHGQGARGGGGGRGWENTEQMLMLEKGEVRGRT